MTHTDWMQHALGAAHLAAEQGEVPVGAVIARDDEIIAVAHNMRETSRDATQHAELTAIRLACARLNSWRLLNTTLYTTLEPCLMCSGAIYQARIPRVVFGVKEERYAGLTFIHAQQTELCNHRVELTSGIEERACRELLTSFFRTKRHIHQG